MKNSLIEFFNNEYNDAVKLFINKPYWFNPVETVDNAIQRCLGVAHFVQINSKNIDYNEIEYYYNETKEKLENLLTNSL